jgi:outer membrane lipoprotein LolB
VTLLRRQDLFDLRRYLVRAALFSTLLLSACATRPPAPTPAPKAAWLQHRASLSSLDHWQVRGRVAIRRGNDGWSAEFDWRQRADSYRIRLWGPFGQGGLEVHGDGKGVWLQRRDAAPVYAHNVDRLLQQETGWQLPVQGLREWLLGLPVSGQPSVMRWDEGGRLYTLNQDGWQIDYRRYRDVGERELPDRLQLQRDSVRVKVVVDKWQIP